MNDSFLQDTLGGIATKHPAAIRVFHRHRIDFCCGGDRPLAEAAREAGLTPVELAGEIRAEEQGAPTADVRWDEAGVEALIDHVVTRFHGPLPADLELLATLSETVLQVHGPKDPAAFSRLDARVRALAADLLQHLRQEEDVVFPWLRSGDAPGAAEAVAALEQDHRLVGAALDALRADVAACGRSAECATWHALERCVEDLERDLHEHVHLENNVLFPRALRG